LTPASAQTREYPAEEAVGRKGSRNRGDEEDQHKKMVSAPARRPQVGYAQSRGLSGRRACQLMRVARSTLGYQPRMPGDTPALAAMIVLSAQYPRYGYRRIQVLLERQGHAWRKHYNEVRPHSSLQNLTPTAFRNSCGTTAKPEVVSQE